MAQECTCEATAKVKSPLGPVQAQPATAMAAWPRFGNDTQARGPLHTGTGERNPIITERNPTTPDQRGEQVQRRAPCLVDAFGGGDGLPRLRRLGRAAIWR
jgi:hypothetical protein